MGNIFELGYRGFSGFRGVCGFSGFHGGGMMGFLLLLIVAVVVYKMFKNNSFSNTTPLDDLKRKYVNGELTEEEYLRKREVLKKK